MAQARKPGDIPVLFEQAWNDRDAVSLAALFAEDADFVNVVGLWWHDRRDIQRAHDYGLKVIFKDSELSARGVKVREVGENVAVIHVRWRLVGQTSKAGEILGQRNTVMVFVAELRDSRWVVVAAQNTDVLPGKETLAVSEGQVEAVNYRE